MLLNLVLDTLKSNKNLREEGKDITIPFPFPRFSQYIPGIQKRRYYIVTANSKVGKTKLADFLFVYTPLLYTKTNKTNIKITVNAQILTIHYSACYSIYDNRLIGI